LSDRQIIEDTKHIVEKTQESIEVFVLLSVEPKNMMSKVEKNLMKLKRIKRIVEILGPYEILVKFLFRDQEELWEVIARLNDLNGVKDALVLVVTKEIKKK